MSSKTVKIDGEISIHTENILPIIKKWLYSENEIFVRELISNAFDATVKLQRVKKIDGIENLPEAGQIQVLVNETEKTITFKDNGIGMDADEVQKYINQIAFSGAEEFVEKYKNKDEDSQIIGHFGLGFYSSFIVSEKVEIVSLSYKKDAQAIHWSCDGSTHFSIKESDKKDVGTEIVLHIGEENKAYLSESKLEELVKKYSNFLPVEIKVGDKVCNDHNPLWIEQPKNVKEDAYKEFYQKLFPYNPDPLFWIHLNVDYPFNLKGILYFPKLKHELDSSKGRIKLFCNQVFVTDEAKDVVPEFLTLLQGAIDCPDIPLNVSRSYLQNDPYVRKISKHIVKKISDKLNELYKKDLDQYKTYWEDIHPFIKYGMMNDSDFYEKVKDIVLFPSSTGESTSISAYLERNKEKMENKVLYCNDKDIQAGYINLCKEQGLEVLFVHSLIDTHFIQFLESKNTEIKYVSVDTEISSLLKEDNADAKVVDPKDNKTQDDKLADLFKTILKKETLKVESESLKNEAVPALLVQSEQSRRMKQMSQMMGQGASLPQFDEYTLVLNTKNPVIKQILKLKDADKQATVDKLCRQVYDLALMNQTALTGDDLQSFIKRSNELLLTLTESLQG